MKLELIRTAVFLLLLSFAVGLRGQEVWIPGAVGRLSAVVKRPEVSHSKRIPMVILMHGFSSHKNDGLVVGLADELARRGIASIRFVFNGHGMSEGEFRHMTVPNEVEDALQVFRYVEQLPWVSKVGLIGHSQGGVVAAMLAGRLTQRKVKSVVLLAPAAVLRDDAIRGNTMGAVYDPLNPPEYVSIGRLQLGREYIQTAFRLPIYETAAAYHGRAAIFHGTADRIVPYTYGLRFHQLWKGSKWYELEGYDHGLGPDARRVIHDVVDEVALHFRMR